jgi:hypothetical protein
VEPCLFKEKRGERRFDVALCFSGRQPRSAKTRRKTHLDPQKREQTVKDQSKSIRQTCEMLHEEGNRPPSRVRLLTAEAM